MRDRVSDRRLIRYLHAELPAAEVQELRAELARDPALQARLHELHRLWQGLKASPPTPVPYGYVNKVQRLAEEQRGHQASSALGWGAAPPWARALAGAALLGGVAIGVGLGRLQEPAATLVSAPPAAAGSATAGIGAGVAASDAGSVVVSKSGAPVVTEGAPDQAATDDAAEPAPGETAAATPDRAIEALFEDGEAGAGSERAASLAGGTTLAEAYWQALASDDAGGGELLAGESGGLW